MKRRNRPKLKFRCAICGRRFGVFCSCGHKYNLPARDRRKLQEEE